MKTVTKQCRRCETEFQAPLKEHNRGNGHYCSSSCSSLHRWEIKPAERKPNTTCAKCKIRFWKKPSSLAASRSGLHFCGRACKDAAQTIEAGIEAILPKHYGKPLNARHCPTCNKLLGRKHRNSKTCSSECQSKLKQRLSVEKWQNGDDDGVRGEGIADFIRRWLHEKHGSKCAKCRWTAVHPVTRKVPLTINHIDGNWRNNDPSNLELICPNCHCLTPNYGSLNRGRGRPNRRKTEITYPSAGAEGDTDKTRD